ncbi:MAG: biotin/lipoyl-containing protein, partial [Chloroflexota bacterium]
SCLDRALTDFEVEGVATTIPLYRLLVQRPDFSTGDYDTGFLERTELAKSLSPWSAPESAEEDGAIEVIVNGRPYRVQLPESLGASAGNRRKRPPRRERAGESSGGSRPAGNELTSPIQGTVLSVEVASGDEVQIGDLICVVEAMKMENELTAHRPGKVVELRVDAGSTVKTGEVVAVIDG